MRVQLESVHRSYRVRRAPETGGRLTRLLRRVSGEVEALRGIDLRVDEGEAVGYIGLNGAGKSTTMKLVAGILTPTSGRVTVDGRDPHAERRRLSAELGYLAAQRASLWWDLPVRTPTSCCGGSTTSSRPSSDAATTISSPASTSGGTSAPRA